MTEINGASYRGALLCSSNTDIIMKRCKKPDKCWCNECETEYKRTYKRKTRYNATPEDFERFDATLNCEICGYEFKGNKDKCMDHCHSTLRVRGALCHKCNRTLGILENRDLESFYKYMKKYG